MTDTSAIAPIDARQSNLQRTKSDPKLGTSLAAMFALLGDAFSMAYVHPYTGRGRRPQVDPDEDFEGRDSSW